MNTTNIHSKLLILLALITISSTSCDAYKNTLSPAATFNYSQDNNSSSQDTSTNDVQEAEPFVVFNDDYAANAREACLKHPTTCSRSVIPKATGGCSAGQGCIPSIFDVAKVYPGDIYTKYTFYNAGNTTPVKTVEVNNTSKKRFLSPVRYQPVIFLEAGKTYDIQMETKHKDGTTTSVRLNNVTIAND